MEKQSGHPIVGGVKGAIADFGKGVKTMNRDNKQKITYFDPAILQKVADLVGGPNQIQSGQQQAQKQPVPRHLENIGTGMAIGGGGAIAAAGLEKGITHMIDKRRVARGLGKLVPNRKLMFGLNLAAGLGTDALVGLVAGRERPQQSQIKTAELEDTMNSVLFRLSETIDKLAEVESEFKKLEKKEGESLKRLGKKYPEEFKRNQYAVGGGAGLAGTGSALLANAIMKKMKVSNRIMSSLAIAAPAVIAGALGGGELSHYINARKNPGYKKEFAHHERRFSIT